MKVQLVGFDWKLGKGVTLHEFFHYLGKKAGEPFDFGDYKRLLYLGENAKAHFGLFLTIKDQRRFCEIRETEGEFKIKVRDLKEGNALVDFNFFAVSKAKLRGLYQQYHHSCGLSQFCLFCKREYDELREERKKQAAASIGVGGISKKHLRAINIKYKGSLKWSILVRPERIGELLKQLKSIQAFDFEYTTLVEHEPWFTPMADSVRAEKHSIRFIRGTPSSVVRDTIARAIDGLSLRRGSVKGKDEQDVQRVFRVLENPDFYGEFEYDDLADEAVLNVKDIKRSSFLQTILETMDEYKTTFGG